MAEKLSDNFSFEELTTTEHRDLLDRNREEAKQYIPKLKRVAVELLEPIRTKYGKVWVNSGFRGPELNKAIGSVPTSQHLAGEAADITIDGIDTDEKKLQVFDWICDESDIEFHQLLIEQNGCVHISLVTGNNDGEIARYDNTTKKKVILRSNYTAV